MLNMELRENRKYDIAVISLPTLTIHFFLFLQRKVVSDM